jgi:cytoskeletal protein CcmA (bactofilin family)
MTCPTPLIHSRYVDGALTGDEALTLESHLVDCVACSESIAAVEAENQALRAAMQFADATGSIPGFVPRTTIPRLLSWIGWAALALWAINMAWMSLVSATATPPWLGWLAPNVISMGIDATVGLAAFLTGESGGPVSMVTASFRWIALISIGLGCLALLTRRKVDSAAMLGLPLTLVCGLMMTPMDSHAFELRRDDLRVTVPAGETVNDTLIAASENVLVEGTVVGDLIAVGESVTVRGRVEGNLFTAAESLNIEGEVTGTVLGLGESVNYRNATVGGNLFSAGEKVTVHAGVTIADNALVLGEETEVHGDVGRDLTMGAQEASLLGTVGRNVRAYVRRVDLGESAEVGGNLTVKAASTDHLQVADGATIAGETNLTTWPEEPSQYTTFEYYVGQILRLAAAFVTGLVLFRLFPGLRSNRLDSGGEVLTTAALGALALIATPLIAFVAVVTLVGAPIGVVSFLFWLVALYLAGIIAAEHVGRLLMDTDSRVMPLLAGLVILFILVNVPLLGGPVRLVVTIVGLGLIVRWLQERWTAREA